MHNCPRCSSLNNQVSQLRTAAIDAAVELAYIKNSDISIEAAERSQRIIQRVFASCEALDIANSGEVAA